MSAPMPRPAPVDPQEAQFWSFVAAGELRFQQCSACRTFRHPPRPVCAQCGSPAFDWVRVSGLGEVWACTTIYPPTLPAFADRTPYNAVVVRLEEGVFMVSNIVDPAVEIGVPVEVAITEVEPGFWLPLFRTTDARP